MKLKKCKAHGCGKEFTPIRKIQIYCSKRCKNREAQRRLIKMAQKGRESLKA